MTRNLWVMLAAGGSAALLAGAFAFQYLGGLQPCVLCIWQRWPHAAAVAIGVVALLLPGRAILYLGALAALTTAGIGGFHVGVEYGWWQGLTTCSTGSIAGIPMTDLLDPAADLPAPVRCDAVAWSLGGISMAGWNMAISFALVAAWLRAARSAV